jgi:hypothetical protein
MARTSAVQKIDNALRDLEGKERMSLANEASEILSLQLRIALLAKRLPKSRKVRS